ncbi:hypothetical protein ALC62_13235 [Cyphomyrmex costatus]|uniref:Uncharacterized protein n=1 Tax=Cyphomyrmex costatus TaxID=456900 RepID=A0A195C7R1_9HYME|nr:hypothetical protein ALC62_13235 [Cyphomyrmex costatus]
MPDEPEGIPFGDLFRVIKSGQPNERRRSLINEVFRQDRVDLLSVRVATVASGEVDEARAAGLHVEHGSSHRESRRHRRSHPVPPIPCPRIPLLSTSPQGFCAPPRNVIFPPAASCRLPIFAEAIIAHRSSDCPFGSPPLAPLFLAIHIGSPPFFQPAQSTSSRLMTETKNRVKEEKERSKILLFSFTTLALCLASIFALTKRNRLCQRVAATTGV